MDFCVSVTLQGVLVSEVLLTELFCSFCLQLADTVPGSVFLLSRGAFTCPPNLPPWRSGTSGIYKKSHRRAPSTEGVPGLERLLKALTELPPSTPPSTVGPQGPLDPYEPLLPLLMGPCMGLWRECYLRGALHAQVRGGTAFYWESFLKNRVLL